MNPLVLTLYTFSYNPTVLGFSNFELALAVGAEVTESRITLKTNLIKTGFINTELNNQKHALME